MMSAQQVDVEQAAAVTVVAGTLTLEQAAKYIGMSESWLYRQAKGKKIPHLRPSRKYLFRLADLDRWLESRLIKAQ